MSIEAVYVFVNGTTRSGNPAAKLGKTDRALVCLTWAQSALCCGRGAHDQSSKRVLSPRRNDCPWGHATFVVLGVHSKVKAAPAFRYVPNPQAMHRKSSSVLLSTVGLTNRSPGPHPLGDFFAVHAFNSVTPGLKVPGAHGSHPSPAARLRSPRPHWLGNRHVLSNVCFFGTGFSLQTADFISAICKM